MAGSFGEVTESAQKSLIQRKVFKAAIGSSTQFYNCIVPDSYFIYFTNSNKQL